MTKTKNWLITALVLIIVGIAGFTGVMMKLNWNFTALSTTRYETDTTIVDTDYKNISVKADTASVEFVLSSDSKVVCYESENQKHSVKVKDNTLFIELVDERKWYEHIGINFTSPKITVYLPKTQYASLFIDESTGDIKIPKVNQKYGRNGALGEKEHFQLEIRGLHHHLAAMSYILRNPLHHGIAPIPYAYPHSSVNVIFQHEMGKSNTDILIPEKSYYKHIGRRAAYPDTYKMNDKGMFLRESVLDIVQVENMFATPRSFDYYMGRKTSEDWHKEQSKDNIDNPPVKLEAIEYGVNSHSLERMLINENGRCDYRKMSDIDVCTVVDHQILPSIGKSSVYQLTSKEKEGIAEILFKTYHIGSDMIRRCLVMKR